MDISKDSILQSLRSVQDPDLQRDIVTLGRVSHVAYCDGHASVMLKLPPQALPHRDALKAEVERTIRGMGDEIREVKVGVTVPVAGGAEPALAGGSSSGGGGRGSGGGGGKGGSSPQEQARTGNPLPNVKHIIAVGAGKGGVGKSTIAVNLAVGLARLGHKVGLLDADIYGPSLPTMLGVDRLEPKVEGKSILPFRVHGIESMTIGALVDDDRPLIWRGPMAHGAFTQLATQTRWGDLDYLVIDLPPGTGDVPLTMAQTLPLDGAVVVCTPQKVAQDDARRAIGMFGQLGIDVLGIVENMSYFVADDGKEYDIFGRGGAEMLALQVGVPFLGAVPINMDLRRNSDAGDPTSNFTLGGPLAEGLEMVVRNIERAVRVAAMEADAERPRVTVR